jgi:hypothetical protein
MNASEHVSRDALELQGTNIGIALANPPTLSDAEAREEFRTWVLTNGFRDAAEVIGAYLDEVDRILSFWEITKRQKDGIQLTGAHWHELVVTRHRRFHRSGLPEKVSRLEDRGLVLDQTFLTHALSINSARNCLVHRRGIVSERDSNDGQRLVVKWTKLALVTVEQDGDRELILPARVEAGTHIGVQNRPETAEFPLGSQVRFSVQQFSDICWTLFLFGESTRARVEQYGRNRGFRFTDENEAST